MHRLLAPDRSRRRVLELVGAAVVIAAVVIVSLAGNADVLVDALSFAFGMFWEILWALILGFALSGVVQAVVSQREMRRLLPGAPPPSRRLPRGRRGASSSSFLAAGAPPPPPFPHGARLPAPVAFA